MNKIYFTKIKLTILFLLVCNTAMFSQLSDVVTGLNKPHGMVLNGTILYYSEYGASKISKIDISVSNPTPTTVISVNSPSDLALKGNELYIASLGRKIYKIDISIPNPTLTTVVNSGIMYPLGLVFNNNELYFCDYNLNKILKIDVSVPNATLTTVIGSGSGPSDLALKGNQLYIASSNKISKIDISVPNPTLTTVVNSGISAPYEIKFNNNELYIADYNLNKILKFDITTATPILYDVVTGLVRPIGLEINNNELYICEFLGNKISKFTLPVLALSSFNKINLSISPNPASNYIIVSGLTEVENYKIYNMLGKEVLQGQINNNDKIDISHLIKGLYLIKIGNKKIKKIIKK